MARRKKTNPLHAFLESVRSAWGTLTRTSERSSRGATAAATSATGRTTWRDFAAALDAAFQAQGYQIVQPAGEAPHRIVDLVLRKDRETFLVQCKHWHDTKVGADAIQAFHGVMQSRGASGGFLVTYGRFSRESVAFAAGCNIRLIDGASLDGLLAKAKPRPASMAG